MPIFFGQPFRVRLQPTRVELISLPHYAAQLLTLPTNVKQNLASLSLVVWQNKLECLSLLSYSNLVCSWQARGNHQKSALSGRLWPYSQMLDYAESGCQGQTLQLIWLFLHLTDGENKLECWSLVSFFMKIESMSGQGPILHFILFVTYEWAQQARVLNPSKPFEHSVV